MPGLLDVASAPEGAPSSVGGGEVEGFADQMNAETEMMIIEIVYRHGRKGKITVKFGDDPKALAEQFVKKYKLKATSVPVVHKHIEQTIAEFHAANQEIRPQTPPAEEDEGPGAFETVDMKVSGGMEEPADILPSPKVRRRRRRRGKRRRGR
jgi:hypothetical protein